MFRRHVTGRPQDLPSPGQTRIFFDLLRQAEIGDFRLALPVEHNIGRLEVAVDDSLLMGAFDRLGDYHDDLGGLPRRQRPIGNFLRQAFAFDERHRKIMLPVVLADFEDGDDAGMIEFGRRFGLGVEPFDVGFVGKLSRQDHFQGHGAIEIHLPRLVDDPHAAAGDLGQQFVVAEITDSRSWRSRDSFRHPDNRRSLGGVFQLIGNALDRIAIAEERLQVAGQIRMRGQQCLPVERLAPFDRMDVISQHLFRACV